MAWKTAITKIEAGQIRLRGYDITELMGNLRPSQLDTQIECVSTILFNPQLRIEIEGILMGNQAVTIVEMDTFIADLDAEIGIADVGGQFTDLLEAIRIRPDFVKR